MPDPRTRFRVDRRVRHGADRDALAPRRRALEKPGGDCAARALLEAPRHPADERMPVGTIPSAAKVIALTLHELLAH